MTTIVTLGGGGFSMSDDGRTLSPIDEYLLELTGKRHPRVCFVGTASGDSDDYRARFLHAFAGRAECSALTLFGKPEYVHPAILREQDLIYVGGGSTVNLLAIWRLHQVPEHLAAAAHSGAILAGISAGMNCWFEASSTDSFGAPAPLHDGLGWLPGTACPHYLGEPHRRDTLHRWVAAGELPDAWAVDDGVAICWRDGSVSEVVTESPGRTAYRVSREDDAAHEAALQARELRNGLFG
ncbi:peptidase E [uncultured Tessaracoccus sp.]|uniref:Type 1 glutamine amidotransferase-like domain-containing protein n=1 Tax=uncultured Tessaracoccus sp. TaxID=905023 RepID=UPI002638E5E7|nr:peptidase E [uncultured Tessaracoccus sp.]